MKASVHDDPASGAAKGKEPDRDTSREPMCEGYWDRKLGRWVSLEEIEERELETLFVSEVKLPSLAAEPKRRPAVLLR